MKQALQTSKNEIAENQNKAEMAYKDLQARYEESENSMETIRNESAKWQRQCDELRLKLEKEDLVKKSIADIAKDKAAVAKAERVRSELEKEVEELNDMVEMLTLDKEQLVIEKDLAEEVSEDLKLEVERLEAEKETMELEHEQKLIEAMENHTVGNETATDDDSIRAISEQNSKLREALLRLRDSTSQEKSELTKHVRELEKTSSNCPVLRVIHKS